MNTENKKQIEQLQILEQNINNLIAQKQQFQGNILEKESALEELNETKSAFKIIGNIMIQSESSKLKKDLNSEKERLELRLKSIEKQEESLRKKASEIQKKVLKSMEEN